MKSLLSVLVVCRCLIASQGSSLRGSWAAEKYLRTTKDELNFRPENNEPLVPTFEEYNGTASVVDLISEEEPSLFLPFSPLNYSEYVDFNLFHRGENSNDFEVTKIPMDAKNILEAGFDKFSVTKVVIHGFGNDINSDMMQKTSRSLAKFYNVIAVDWSKISKTLNYPYARYHVEGVGQYLGQFLSTLYNESLIIPSGVHLVGHSLGAHIAGYAGKTVQQYGWTLARITGLDPAGPLFSIWNNDRLTKNDALQVDVIHTCAGYLGMRGNIGHVDFYPNGGSLFQPGCSWDITGTCSHGRAYEYFIESTEKSIAFIGKYCESETLTNCSNNTIAVMGNYLVYRDEGAFHLTTNTSPPFGLGLNGL